MNSRVDLVPAKVSHRLNLLNFVFVGYIMTLHLHQSRGMLILQRDLNCMFPDVFGKSLSFTMWLHKFPFSALIKSHL